jgi:hypothetical protein
MRAIETGYPCGHQAAILCTTKYFCTIFRQHPKNAIIARDASRAKLVAVGKPFDRLEFDACRVGDE